MVVVDDDVEEDVREVLAFDTFDKRELEAEELLLCVINESGARGCVDVMLPCAAGDDDGDEDEEKCVCVCGC